jgi:ATP-dependent Clp protease adapter protein ClpS
MLVFSQNLSHSLSRAIAQAEQQHYTFATPEHVLMALLDDPDASPVMQACNIDLEKLRGAVEASMPHWLYEQDLDEQDSCTQELDEPDDAPDSDEDDPDEPDDALDQDEGIPVQHFQVVLQRAIAHAGSSGCDEVDSADVLVAMFDGPVGDLLNAHGLTRYDATTFICHGISKDAQASSLRDDAANRSRVHAPSVDVPGSPTFKVRFLNDSYTPMDFVVQVLEEVLELTQEDAERIMLEIHREGAGACGAFTREEADEKVARIMDLARQQQHPLRCGVQQ